MTSPDTPSGTRGPVVAEMFPHGEALVASTAIVCADVTLARGVTVWYGSVIRGDSAPITVGELTNVQDMAVIHADTGVPNDIGSQVSIGHGATVHGRRVGDRCLIGMGAILLGACEIGDECIVAAGSVVREGAVIPPRSLVAGVPARVVRQVSDEEIAQLVHHAEHYYEVLGKSHVRG
jgi:carbonic anhydrase/acetyltransferase-like protein (isoleucine patch superfamily)